MVLEIVDHVGAASYDTQKVAGTPSLQSRIWLGRYLAEWGAFADGIALAGAVMRVAEGSAAPTTRVAAYRDLSHPHGFPAAAIVTVSRAPPHDRVVKKFLP